MKKIVSIVLLMVAFGFSGNAQSNLKLESNTKSRDQKVNPKEEAYKDVKELSNLLELSPEVTNSFLEMLVMRNEALINAKSDEEKRIVYDRFGKKLLSSLNDEQLKKLHSNKELHFKLTGRKE
jgi:hypothetical protein